MKKFICAVFILFALFMTLTGCNLDKETYTVKKVMIDVNGESILLEINKDTLQIYPGVTNAINSIGNKIVIKNNECIFNGNETKRMKSIIDFDDECDEYYIKFSELPPIIFKGSKILDNEIYIYIPVNKTLSCLIYEKNK